MKPTKEVKKVLDDYARENNWKNWKEMAMGLNKLHAIHYSSVENIGQSIWNGAYTQCQKDMTGFEVMSKANKRLCEMCREDVRTTVAQKIFAELDNKVMKDDYYGRIRPTRKNYMKLKKKYRMR